MRKVSFLVAKNNNEEMVKDCFNNYLINPCTKTIITLLKCILSFELCNTNINEINLEVKKIDAEAGFDEGKITINSKLIKNAKKVENLPELLNALFHELTHAIIDFYNNQILSSKKLDKEYLPNFRSFKVFELLKRITPDIEMASAGVSYFYLRNKNEKLARKKAIDLTNKYILTYAQALSHNLKSFKMSEFLLNDKLKNDFPFINQYAQFLEQEIKRYQLKTIKNGLVSLSAYELEMLLDSFALTLLQEVKSELVKELYNCEDFERVKKVISLPYVELSPTQEKLLINLYGQGIKASFYVKPQPEKELGN